MITWTVFSSEGSFYRRLLKVNKDFKVKKQNLKTTYKANNHFFTKYYKFEITWLSVTPTARFSYRLDVGCMWMLRSRPRELFHKAMAMRLYNIWQVTSNKKRKFIMHCLKSFFIALKSNATFVLWSFAWRNKKTLCKT